MRVDEGRGVVSDGRTEQEWGKLRRKSLPE